MQNAEQSRAIVSAVTDTFLAEIGDRERAERLNVLSELRDRAARLREEERKKNDQFQQAEREWS